MLSQLITDLEVVRSLVSQNGKKIGEIETDIKNKSDANENAHQDIEGTNSNRSFTPIFEYYGDRTMGTDDRQFETKIVLQRVSHRIQIQ